MTPETASHDNSLDALPAGERRDMLKSLDLFLWTTQSVIDQLGALRKSLFQRLLRKGMGHEAFKNSPLGDIPVSWDVRSLGEIASLTSGKTKPKDSSRLRSQSRSVPIYGGNGLLGFTSNPLREGSTVIIGRIGARSGVVHFVADEASWITDNALFVYKTRPEIDLRFLSYSLFHLNLWSLRNMGRQPLISLATIYPVLLAVPPLAEQREISDVLHCLETLAEAQDKVFGQTKKLRSALLAGPAGESPGSPQ
jgi:type I restriction enzyme, S subunit